MTETEYEKLVKRLERASVRLADHVRSGLADPNAEAYRRELREAVEAMHEYLNRPPENPFRVTVPAGLLWD